MLGATQQPATGTQRRPVRVLVVDDDPVFRRIVCRTIEAIPGATVAGQAGTVAVAKRRLETGDVDVVTLDVVLDGESGLDLLAALQASRSRVATVLLTSGASGAARTEVDAMFLGAGALLLKPSGAGAQEKLTRELARIFEGLAAKTAPVTPSAPPAPARSRPDAGSRRTSDDGSRRTSDDGSRRTSDDGSRRTSDDAAPRELLAVGSSTGGPPALLRLLEQLSPGFDLPIVITQHIPAPHAESLAELLARQSRRDVRLADADEPLRPGRVYLAGRGLHLLVARQGGALRLVQDDGPPEHFCKPAVDPLFRSVAEACGAACVGVVLTGMGRDGAAGAQALRAAGAPVVVQDQATSVVWGMPGAVVAAGAASSVLPLDEVAGAVERLTLPRRRA